MKKLTLHMIWISMLLLSSVVGCTSADDEPETTGQQQSGLITEEESAAPTDTPKPTSAPSPTPEPTDPHTPEPSQTYTNTPSPVPTDTPESTTTPTVTQEPTPTPTTQPDLVVTAASINLRLGPGTNYGSVGVAIQGEELVVIGKNSGCQWLKVESTGGISGWATSGAEYVSLNLECSEIAIVEGPQPPASTVVTDHSDSESTATPQSPPAGGTGRITLVNDSDEYAGSVGFGNCCERFHLAADPGETRSIELPADEYQWSVAPHGCLGSLPQLFLTDGMEITVRLVPIQEGCGFYAEVTFVQSGGEVQVVTYPLDERGF